jgi:hypothetical protein
MRTSPERRTRGLKGVNPLAALAESSAVPHHTDDPAERARRMSVLQRTEATFEPLPFNTAAALTFGLVSAAVVVAGHKPRHRIVDLMIASIAITNRLPLLPPTPAISPAGQVRDSFHRGPRQGSRCDLWPHGYHRRH